MTTAVSGVVLLVFSFFHWYSVDLGPFGTYSRNGWQSPDSFWSIIAILIGIVLAAHVIVEKLTGVDLPERLGSVGWGVVHLAGGAVAFIFILIKWLTNTRLRHVRAVRQPDRRRRPRGRRVPDGQGSRRAPRRPRWRQGRFGTASHRLIEPNFVDRPRLRAGPVREVIRALGGGRT